MMELSPSQIGGLGVAALLVLCFIGVRFAFAAAMVGTAGLTMLIGWDAGLRTAGIVPSASGANYTLSVLPMFILIGYLAYYAGITQTAFEAARRWFGWLPGGLATGTVFAVAGFSAVSGASSAAAAVFAKVAIPEMLRAGYNKRLAAGVCAAGATLDSLIPPSTLLVVYGIITEQSIGKLLIAGFVPGLISALVYAVNFNIKAWNALPAEYKKILEDARPEAYKLQREAYAAADEKSLPLFEKRKLEVIKISPEMRDKLISVASKPVWDKWVAETEAKGLPGKEALELVLSLIKKHSS